jgi:hypothetical protein
MKSLDRLKSLLRMASADLGKPEIQEISPRVDRDKGVIFEEPKPQEIRKGPEPIPAPIDPNKRPPSLEGISVEELFRMDCDGEFTPEEADWFRRKSARFPRRPYIPPKKERRR